MSIFSYGRLEILKCFENNKKRTQTRVCRKKNESMPYAVKKKELKREYALFLLFCYTLLF